VVRPERRREGTEGPERRIRARKEQQQYEGKGGWHSNAKPPPPAGTAFAVKVNCIVKTVRRGVSCDGNFCGDKLSVNRKAFKWMATSKIVRRGVFRQQLTPAAPRVCGKTVWSMFGPSGFRFGPADQSDPSGINFGPGMSRCGSQAVSHESWWLHRIKFGPASSGARPLPTAPCVSTEASSSDELRSD